MAARIDQVVTSGTFSLDGQDFDVDNNVWIVGDDEECIVIDPAHDAAAILAAIGERELLAVICTHGHNDHINAAVAVAEEHGAEIAMHPDDMMLWEAVYDDDFPDITLAEGGMFEVAGVRLDVLHTPGHSPGAVCLYAPDLDVIFSGDTLFKGGPGATGRSYSDFPTILRSIKGKLLTLPPFTRVLTGHGEETTIGAESPDYEAWVERGH
jgi:glyoxylase-like metal-dependent hydrolase (beta-lactamase superfamily II)